MAKRNRFDRRLVPEEIDFSDPLHGRFFKDAVRKARRRRELHKAGTVGQASSTPATYHELKAACPGASSDFIVRMLEAQASADAAVNALIEENNAELERLRSRLAAAQDMT